MQENLIQVKPISTKEAEEAKLAANEILEKSRSLLVTNQNQYDEAADMLKQVKGRMNTLETRRKEITKPLDVAKKSVMDLFRAPLDVYSRVERTIKQSILTYHTEQERKAQEEQERLRKKAEAEEAKTKKKLEERAQKAEEKGNAEKAEELREKAEEVNKQAPIVSSGVDKVQGMHFTETWYGKVVDFSKLPNEYKLTNQQAINKVAQAVEGKIAIPGVEFYSKKDVASRRR